MHILLIILLVIVGIIALLLILALFSKKGYSIRREIIINRPQQQVFDYVRLLRNQDYFSKWVMTDPNMKKEFTGTDGQAGFIYAWDGNNKAGKGEQEIRNIRGNEQVDIEVRFVKPFKAIAQTPFTLATVAQGQTKVSWTMNSSMNYPMNAMLLFMNMEKLLGKDMDISLNNLKTILEKS